MSSVCRGLRSSAMFRLEEEEKVSRRKGIGSILGSERPSLRRTFSADMSSNKWLVGVKKVASSQEISTMASSPRDSSSSSSSEDEEEVRRKDMKRPGQFDIWSSILSQKEMDSKTQPPSPYIHPLVKRSLSSLSEKSLEICTENLGSETGSDGFSSTPDDLDYSASEVDEEEKQEERVQKDVIIGDGTSFQGNNNRNQNQNQPRTPTHERSFPPPLPSLSRDGPCFHMKPHRKNGRLVLEAVPIPSHNLFHTQREKGRLVLTFINTPTKETKVVTQVEETQEEETKVEQVEESQEENEEIEVEEEVKVDRGIMMEVKVRQKELVMSMLMSGSCLTMENRNRIPNRNPYLNLWAGEKMDKEKGTVEPRRMDSTVSRLLPTVNVYECYRRNTASPAIFVSPATPNNNKVGFSKKLPLLLKNVNDLGQLASVRRCTEPHSTTVIWEPYCIPTS